MKKRSKLLYVEWLDHYTDTDPSWKEAEDISEIDTLTCSSVGWVVSEDKTHIRLAATCADISDGYAGSGYDGIITIVKSCITKKKVLKW